MEQELTYKEAKSLSSNIRKTSDSMNELLNNSDSLVKKIQGNWEGVAADAAIEQWSTWKRDFAEYYEMLLLNVENINKACDEFAKAEAEMKQGYGE